MRKKKQSENAEKSLLLSYLTIRTVIGILGIALPIVMVSGSYIKSSHLEILSSISCYYHTGMRDQFVGILCAVALFLFTYKGYDRFDNIVGNLGGLFALGVAFLPTIDCVEQPSPRAVVIGNFHSISATLLFAVLIFFSLVLFTKSDLPRSKQNKRKKHRNRVYRICGWVMVICILTIAFYYAWPQQAFPSLTKYSPVFWLETLTLWAFGISWLVKGELFWKDIDS
jgi:hypothetical protein